MMMKPLIAALVCWLPLSAGAVDIGGPATGPVLITEPGTYTCSAPVSWPGRTAIHVNADNVTITGCVVRDSYTCIEVALGRSHVRILGGTFERCQKIAITMPGGGTDNEVLGVTCRDSGNCVLAYTVGVQLVQRFKFIGNACYNMGGAVDGHCLGMQSFRDVEVANNVATGAARSAYSFYWNGGATEQSGLRMHHNSCENGLLPCVAMRATSGTGTGRFNNLLYDNSLISGQPFVVTGGNTLPGQWSAELWDNYASGTSQIKSAVTDGCSHVYLRNSGTVIGQC